MVCAAKSVPDEESRPEFGVIRLYGDADDGSEIIDLTQWESHDRAAVEGAYSRERVLAWLRDPHVPLHERLMRCAAADLIESSTVETRSK